MGVIFVDIWGLKTAVVALSFVSSLAVFYTHTHTYTRTHTHTHTHTHAHTHTNTHTHTHKHILTHTHTHIYIFPYLCDKIVKLPDAYVDNGHYIQPYHK